MKNTFEIMKKISCFQDPLNTRGEFPNIPRKNRALGSVDNIKRKLSKCHFHSLIFESYFLLCGKFFNISMIALFNSFIKNLFVMSVVPFFAVQPMFE